MIKPLAENLNMDLETVEDIIKVLLTAPKEFMLHPLGQKCQIGIDYVHECVYMDEPALIGEYSYELIHDAKEIGDPVEIDIPDEKLATYQPELIVVMGYSDLYDNGSEEAQLMGVFSNEDLATECGDELVEAGVITRYEFERPMLDEFGYK